MIDLNQIADAVLDQAKEKGWGHTQEMLSVAEKISLIHCEISEYWFATQRATKSVKDTPEAELADILLRTLHLGKVWEVDFGKQPATLKNHGLLYLHRLTSLAYDYYRHKKNTLFKKYLNRLVWGVVALAESTGVDLRKAVQTKLEINKSRVWKAKALRGNYYDRS